MICGAGDAQCCLGGSEGHAPPTDLQDQFHEFVVQVDRRLLQLEQSLSELYERVEVVEEEDPEEDDELSIDDEPPSKIFRCSNR